MRSCVDLKGRLFVAVHRDLFQIDWKKCSNGTRNLGLGDMNPVLRSVR